MTSSSLSNAERLSALQVRLADLNQEFETSSWAEVDIVDIHAEILDTEYKISLLQTDFENQI